MLALFNVNGSEYLIIAVVALVILGPEQLPSTLRRVGGYVRQFRDMGDKMRGEFLEGMNELDPTTWEGSRQGKGTDADPIVPRGYAKEVSKGGPFDRRVDEATGTERASSAGPTPKPAADQSSVDNAAGDVAAGDAAPADAAPADAADETQDEMSADEVAAIAPTDPWGRAVDPRPAMIAAAAADAEPEDAELEEAEPEDAELEEAEPEDAEPENAEPRGDAVPGDEDNA